MTRLLLVCAALITGSTAQGACSHNVTSLALITGGPAQHLTAVDQLCNPLHPNTITWSVTGEAVTITGDSTGFNISVPNTDVSGTATAGANYNSSPVTGLQFLPQ
jgi:hypothetical protein